ncbi:MAG TPA: hypothetical protein VKB79_22130 [Bryobacteraceae bacterium]|nr:hypothetical protein [Bryobacteraceae bacterium]
MTMFVFAVLYGIAAALAFRWLTDSAKIRAIVNRMVARVMEFALFADQPRVIFRAQAGLMKANFDLLRHIALPTLVLAIPLMTVYPMMKRHYSAVEGNVLTLPLGSSLPAGVVAETPPVHVMRTREVSWRVKNPPHDSAVPHWQLWFGVTATAAAVCAGFVRTGSVRR